MHIILAITLGLRKKMHLITSGPNIYCANMLHMCILFAFALHRILNTRAETEMCYDYPILFRAS